MTISRLCAAAALIIFWVSPTFGADLLDVYKEALKSDPLLREAEANRLAALESRPQARSALYPQLSFNATQSYRDDEGAQSQFSGGGFLPIAAISNSDQTSLTLQLRQTVFRWDQWLSFRQADKLVTQADVDYRFAEQDLMLRVAESYFNVLSARDQLESSRGNKEAIARQLEQSETRFEVGLIAITDVQESRAAYDQAVAAEIRANRVLRNAHENLRLLTGTYTVDLENPDTSLPLVTPQPSNQDVWVQRSLEQNLNLLSSRLSVQIAKDTIDVQRAGHLPTVDLVARSSDFEDDTNRTTNGFHNPTISDQRSAVIELQLNVPIYSGGRVSSQTRESVYQHRAAKERFERVARETERQTRDAYVGISSDISTIKALEQALASTETALKATEAGFEVGTRTTVDVLDARRDLLSAQTNLERSRYDFIINLMRLKQAAGTLNAADLVEINDWLH